MYHGYNKSSLRLLNVMLFDFRGFHTHGTIRSSLRLLNVMLFDFRGFHTHGYNKVEPTALERN
ncbi:MAG: hypothetical protein RLZZ292_2468, partial [Bacteroidota bacterium]